VVRVDRSRHHLDSDRVLAGSGCCAQGAQLLRLFHLQPDLLPRGSDRRVHGPRPKEAGYGLTSNTRKSRRATAGSGSFARTQYVIETGGM